MALGRPAWRDVRVRLQNLITQTPHLFAQQTWKDVLVPQHAAKMHLPFLIGDYTDFYASKEHVTNVGTMFRGKENGLMPNW